MRSQKREYSNRYGRKGTRGSRPWFLIPKVLSLAIFVGAYASATVLWFYYRAADAEWAVEAVSLLFRWLVAPAVIATLVFGILLLLQHPKVFLQRRWLQVKLAIVLLLPAVHFLARSSFKSIKVAIAGAGPVDGTQFETQCSVFSACLIVGLSAALVVLFLGRHKPRLGQHPKPLDRTRLTTQQHHPDEQQVCGADESVHARAAGSPMQSQDRHISA